MPSVEINSPPPCRVEPLLLVQEISHRVVNEYSQAIAGIRLAACAVKSNEAREALSTAAARLTSYAEAHRALQLPAGPGTADLADHLSRLCSTMAVARLQERGVNLTLTADCVMLSAERCWRVALIVSELITNSLRHGLRDGPGHIWVELEAAERTILCRVLDNGRSRVPVKPGCGFHVVSGLASEVKGTVNWAFGPDGASVELSFPSETALETLI